MNAAILQVAAVVQLGLAKACAHAAASTRASLRDAAEIERLKVDLALTREELRITWVAFRPSAMRVEIECYLRWYQLHRPHQGSVAKFPLTVGLSSNPPIDPACGAASGSESAAGPRSKSSPSRGGRNSRWSSSDEQLTKTSLDLESRRSAPFVEPRLL